MFRESVLTSGKLVGCLQRFGESLLTPQKV